MSENFAKINSVREIVNFSEDNDFKQEIFQNVDFKNFGNSHQLQTHSRLEFPTLSQEKNPKKIDYFRKNNNDNNPGQASSIRQEIYDSTLFLLPKISAHYAVKNLQELQEIDEVHRKLLAIDDEISLENKENNLPPLNQANQPLEANLNESYKVDLTIKKNQNFVKPKTSVEISSYKKCAESLVRKSRILVK
jgi:hypothetical protein